MRWKFGRDRNNSYYTCCFCCHVRMGTVFIGIFSLFLELMTVAVFIAMALHPELSNHKWFAAASYYTNYGYFSEDSVNSTAQNSTMLLSRAAWNCDDKLVGLLLMAGSIVFTVSLLYGVIRGRPRCLLPFFCIQIFDFCITTLTVIGYFSYEPDIKIWIMSQKFFPFKQQLLQLEYHWLMMMAAFTAIVIIWIQAYCINIVWNCYKYLLNCQIRQVHPGNAANMNPEVACDEPAMNVNEITLPPKYEDVVLQKENEEQNQSSTPPPPYTG